ncbi:M28 family peptidase [Novosphingobium sp.]|uniref:M28 family peptidase n=1 Tax=Novosphingobium sp. TaxID=1874826 RepID=UPI0025EBE1C1|nr:M28 family peptidase [Novosphingobium sp.]MCC6924734.1 M28 family peptidase [Novosphingobium sp.]
MRNIFRAAALSALLSATASQAAPAPDDLAWQITEGLTTEIGARPAGSEREARARDWAVARLTALGFRNVRVEPFTVTGFVRGAETAELTAPYPHKLHITALGYSVPTPKGGLKAELVYFPTLDALKAAPEGSLKGKVAFIDHAFVASQDGAGYGPYGAVRRQGPAIAASKGAAAAVIRSVGTDHNRDPHTGVASFTDPAKAIPAGAVSIPDALLIARIAKTGKPMMIDLVLEGRPQANMPSGNVIAELPGRDPTLPPVMLACHLDSWDLGTGAIDDAAGCGIITAAALRTQRQGQPLRTIRVLWAGSEEIGVFGGAAYGKAHAAEPHALVMESDFGADRVWRVKFNLSMANQPLRNRIAAGLALMGIVPAADKANGGADTGAIIAAQKPGVIDLDQDGTRYFDLHHTPDDTLDKVDPVQLEQNVAAWTVVLKEVANEAGPIKPAE